MVFFFSFTPHRCLTCVLLNSHLISPALDNPLFSLDLLTHSLILLHGSVLFLIFVQHFCQPVTFSYFNHGNGLKLCLYQILLIHLLYLIISAVFFHFFVLVDWLICWFFLTCFRFIFHLCKCRVLVYGACQAVVCHQFAWKFCIHETVCHFLGLSAPFKKNFFKGHGILCVPIYMFGFLYFFVYHSNKHARHWLTVETLRIFWCLMCTCFTNY